MTEPPSVDDRKLAAETLQNMAENLRVRCQQVAAFEPKHEALDNMKRSALALRATATWILETIQTGD